ncbi:MAG: hypothetical protein Q8R78_05845 [Candidatus Omnitrophota bacterium]|nr:hypothetical protein [Candidatus Omnitrophota bacterium]
MSYEFRQFRISDHMMDAIRRYIDEGLRPGDFLTAVIDNDLKEAVSRADDENLANLPAFICYFYNEAPAGCWGSRENRLAFLKKHSEEREIAIAKAREKTP